MRHCYEFRRAILTVDVALFALSRPNPQEGFVLDVVVLPRANEPFRGRDALPGGYVRTEEDRDAESAAHRMLWQKCGMFRTWIEQLRTYSGADRDPTDWSATIAHWGVVPPLDPDREWSYRGIPAEGAAGLPFDHDAIVADALARLRGKSSYTSLPMRMLPPSFTMGELQDAYEAALGRRMNAANFRRKMLALEAPAAHGGGPLLVEREEARSGRHRPAATYSCAVPGVVPIAPF